MMMALGSYGREVELEGERTAFVKNKWSSTYIGISGYIHIKTFKKSPQWKDASKPSQRQFKYEAGKKSSDKTTLLQNWKTKKGNNDALRSEEILKETCFSRDYLLVLEP